jgi:hypothetical protein
MDQTRAKWYVDISSQFVKSFMNVGSLRNHKGGTTVTT